MNPTSLLSGLGAAVTAEPTLGAPGGTDGGADAGTPGAGSLFLSLVTGLLGGDPAPASPGAATTPTAGPDVPLPDASPASLAAHRASMLGLLTRTTATPLPTAVAPAATAPAPAGEEPGDLGVPGDAATDSAALGALALLAAAAQMPPPPGSTTAPGAEVTGAPGTPGAVTTGAVTTGPSAMAPTAADVTDITAPVDSSAGVATAAPGPTPGPIPGPTADSDPTSASPPGARSDSPAGAPSAAPSDDDRRVDAPTEARTSGDGPASTTATPSSATTATTASPAASGSGAATSTTAVVGSATVGTASAPSGGDVRPEGARVTGQVFPEVVRVASAGAAGGTQRVTITLRPESLGEVRVVLTHHQGGLRVTLAGGEDARRALADGAPELRRMLEAVGRADSRIVVRDLPAGAGASTATAATPSPDGSALRTDVSTDLGNAWSGAGRPGGEPAAEREATPLRTSGSTIATDGTPDATNPSRPLTSDTSGRLGGLDVSL